MSIVRSVGFGTFIKLFNWTWSAWPEYWCFSWLEVGDQLGFSVRQEFPTSSWHSGFSKHFPRRSRRRWDCYLDFANHGGMRILSSSRPLDKPMLDGNLYSGGFIFSISFCYSNFQSTEDIFPVWLVYLCAQECWRFLESRNSLYNLAYSILRLRPLILDIFTSGT